MVTLPKSAKKGPSLPGKATKAAPAAPAMPAVPKKPTLGSVVQPPPRAASKPAVQAPPQLRRPTPPPAPVEEDFAAMFEAPAEEISTSGLSFEDAMAQGKKGSQMFGVPPQTSAELPEDDDSNEEWEDDVDYELEGVGPDELEADQQAAQSALTIRASKQVALVEPEAQGGDETFSNVVEAEEYWNSTFIPYGQLTDQQKRLRLEAADTLIRDRRMRRDMLLALVRDEPDIPDEMNLYVRLGPKNGQTQGTTSQSGTSQGPTSTSQPKSTNASSSAVGGTFTVGQGEPQTVQTAKGPMKLPPGLQQGTAGLRKPQPPKAGGVAEGAATSPFEGAHNPMLDRCQRVAARCNSQRQSHMKGAGPCFDPQCQCMGKCLSFFERPVEVPNEPVYEMVDEDTGEVVGRVPSTKSAGTSARVGQGQGAVPGRNVQRPAQQPQGQQDVRGDGDGGFRAQGGQQTGQQGGEPGGRWEETDEAQGGGAEEPLMVDGKVFRDMLTLKRVGTALDSNYWPASTQKELSGVGGAESRRNAIIERLVTFWEKGIINKEGQLRPELDLTSNSYRVILGAFNLFNAIEDYAGARLSSPALDKEAEMKIATAAKEYLDAHKDVPPGEIDCDWADYENYCAQYGLQVGESLSQISSAH